MAGVRRVLGNESIKEIMINDQGNRLELLIFLVEVIGMWHIDPQTLEEKV